jgi:MFS family permease
MGWLLMLQSLIIGECFGMVSFGTVAGMAGVFITLGGAFGPGIAGFIYDAMQSYQLSFTLFAAACVPSIGAVFFARTPRMESIKKDY